MTQPVIVPDPYVSPLLTALRDCLCDVLSSEPYTPVCECCIVHPGDFPPMDVCDCECTAGEPPRPGKGSAWVQVVNMYKGGGSDPRSRDFRSCAGLTVVSMRLGVYRCVAVPGEDGTPPSCETVMNESFLLLQDAAAMRRAVTCCTGIADADPVIRGWEAVPPKGGCAGGALSVDLWMNMWAPVPS